MKSTPRWAAWLDALAIILFLLAIQVAVSHGLRFTVGREVVTVGSAWRPLVLGLALVAWRHWRVPAPTALHTVANALGMWRREPYGLILRVWAASRIGVLLAGLFAVLIIGVPAGHATRDPVRHLPARWDAAWYAGIAREGYSYDPRAGAAEQQTVVFFPAYPMLLRVAAVFTDPERTVVMTHARYLEVRDSRLMWAGVALSTALFLGALVAFYRWVELKADPGAAAAAVVFAAAYPFAVFYSAPYTESLFLLATVGACLAFERQRWAAAALAGLVAGLTRPNGAMLSLTLAILALGTIPIHPISRSNGDRPRFSRVLTGLAVAAMPGVGMLLYSGFIYSLTGDPFTWMKVQQAWGRSFSGTANFFGVLWHMVGNYGLLAYIRETPVEALQAAATLFALAMTWPVWRRLGTAYAVFMLANLLPPLLKGGVLSMGRMTSTLFPMFAALALVIPAERRPAWILFFAAGQGLIAAIFFTWRHVY